MKKTLKIKLIANEIQSASLGKTVSTFREVCNLISKKSFKTSTFNQIALHKIVYRKCRDTFPGFSSQLIVRAIAVVADSYKLDRRHVRIFKGGTAVYDSRVLTWKNDIASIWTVDGRLKIPVSIWNEQLFHRLKGEADLVCNNGKWFLHITIDIEAPKSIATDDWLGVDLGIVNLATTSDGTIFAGQKVEETRQRYASHRQRLQIRNTKSSRRRIRATGNKEARFRKDVNHVISKEIVRKAKGTCSGIALEELTHIRKRTTVRKNQRAKHTGWAFAQLREFITYKAMEVGVPIQVVSPKYTSRICSTCGCQDKKNRKNQSEFVCISCNHVMNADLNASINISNRAAINQPIVSV